MLKLKNLKVSRFHAICQRVFVLVESLAPILHIRKCSPSQVLNYYTTPDVPLMLLYQLVYNIYHALPS